MLGKPIVPDRFLKEELEEDIGLNDYEVDRIEFESKELLQDRDLRAEIKKINKTMDTLLIGLSVVLFVGLFVLAFLWKGYAYYAYFFVIVEIMLVYWRFFLSPLRHNNFQDDFQYLKYRAFITQGRRAKAHLRDEKYKFLVFAYMLLNLMVICSLIDANHQLYYLNLIIFDRGNFPDSTVSSLGPAVVFLGIVVNLFGAFVASRYRKINPQTGEKEDDPETRQIVLITVFFSMVFFIGAGIFIAPEISQFWTPSEGRENLFFLFDDEDPLFHARVTILLFYIFVYLGALALGLLIMIGISAIEAGLLYMMIRKRREKMEPPEKNWEFSGTLARREVADKAKLKARKFSLGEIIIMCVLMILGMWVFLWWGGTIVQNDDFNDIMNIGGYIVLGIAILWAFFFSEIYHAKRDGWHYYPSPKYGVGYAAFDERGLGSVKQYFREVWRKKNRLLGWVTYWFLVSMAFALVEWEDIWDGSSPKGALIDLTKSFADPNVVVTAIPLIIAAMSIIGFIVALNQTKENFRDSLFWTHAYKVIMGIMIIVSFGWVTMMPHITTAVDFNSGDFFVGLGATVGIFIVLGILAVLFIFPVLVKFDNLHVTRNAILQIIITTIVLTMLIVLFFHWFIPMSGLRGQEITNIYPFDSGVQNETKTLWENFRIMDLLNKWIGYYLWWGALQQFLFMSYFLELWRKVFPNSKGYWIAFGTACIFGVIHFPDWPLMLFTALMGMVWAYNWNAEYYDPKTGKVYRGNNLLLWGLVHGFGGSLIGFLLPFSMAVGPFNM